MKIQCKESEKEILERVISNSCICPFELDSDVECSYQAKELIPCKDCLNKNITWEIQ